MISLGVHVSADSTDDGGGERARLVGLRGAGDVALISCCGMLVCEAGSCCASGARGEIVRGSVDGELAVSGGVAGKGTASVGCAVVSVEMFAEVGFSFVAGPLLDVGAVARTGMKPISAGV